MPNRLSRYCDGVMEAGWLLALVLAPLYFNVYSSRVFEPDKIALVRSLALVVGAAWLIKLGLEGGPRWEHIPRAQASGLRRLARLPLALPVAAFVGIYLLSTLASVSRYASIFGSYQRLQGTFTTFSYIVLFAAIAANLRSRAQAERLLTTVVVTSLPISFYGILQRYQLDPLPWGGDTTARVTANMGNAIFVAAYLIMSALIVLGRVVTSFHDILTRAEDIGRNMIRATAYIFILALNLVAIWYSGSRGPMLGLGAGLFFFVTLLALYWRVRAVVLGWLLLNLIAGSFLLVFNLPNGPLEPLRQVPGLGRLGGMLEEIEGRTGTGRVRALIWDGVVRLMRPHPPLEQPDGTPDAWNALRPWIGYGPESLYVSFNRFYPPELGQLEARNATPDRSHNETFDALAFTGLIGLGVYLALFTAVFYYGLKWVGFVGSLQRRNAFFALVLGGGLAGAAGFVLWQGPNFFGVGLPFGMLLGLIGFLTLYALRGAPEMETVGQNQAERWRAIALISLLSAVIAHFVEIHFGIAIVSTRTHFWAFAGLMCVLGYALPAGAAAPAGLAPSPSRGPAPRPTEETSRRRSGRAARQGASAAVQAHSQEWGPVVASAGLLTAVLLTLGFDYISNPSHSTDLGRVLSDAFFVRPTPEGPAGSFAIFGLILITWAVGGAVAYLEEAEPRRPVISGLAASLALALMVGGFSWLVTASRLAAIAAFTPRNQTELLTATTNIASVLSLFYAALMLLLLAWAGGLPGQWPARSAPAVWGVNTIWYLALPLMVGAIIVTQNLMMIQADIIYKTGLQFDDQGQPELSVDIYRQAIDLVEDQDYYYLFLGRSYLNATSALTDTVQRERVLTEAEAQLKKAQNLNPLNTDHTANLARLNRQWAALTPDPGTRDNRLGQADAYYQQATRLSPNNAGLWNEWAMLRFQQMGDGPGAQEKLDQSLALDRKFEQTYQIQGDLLMWQAQNAADAAAQEAIVAQAIEAYRQGVGVVAERGGDTTNLRVGLASAYSLAGQIGPAIDQYQQLLGTIGESLRWQVFRAIADLYWRQGDAAQTRLYLQQALALAPEAERPALEAFLNSLPAGP